MMQNKNVQSSPLESVIKVPRPYFEWKPESYGIDDILKTHDLPVTVQCDLHHCQLPLGSVEFDLTQPLLLYTKQNDVTKVAASSVVYDKSRKKFQQVGKVILIPKQYAGWFAILGDPKNNSDKTVIPSFRLVKQLSESKCERFLIGGSKQVNAFEIRRGKNIYFYPRTLNPGDVLQKGNQYEQIMKWKTKWPFLKSRLTTQKFLICLDADNRECLLPYENSGEFYPVSECSTSSGTPVLQMTDVADTVKYPCLVKLLYGKLPMTPCVFTEFLILNTFYNQSAVIVSTILNLKNVLLELPVNLQLKFHVALPTGNLLSNPGYVSAMTVCRETADVYGRSIKISYSFPETLTKIPSEQMTKENLSISSLKKDNFSYSDLDDSKHSQPDNGSDVCFNDTITSHEQLLIPSPTMDTSADPESDYITMNYPFVSPQAIPLKEEQVSSQDQNLNLSLTTESDGLNTVKENESSVSECTTTLRRNTSSICERYAIHGPVVRRCLSIVSDILSDIDSAFESEENTNRRDTMSRIHRDDAESAGSTLHTSVSSVRTDLGIRDLEDEFPVGAESSMLEPRHFSTGEDSGVDSEWTRDDVCERLSGPQPCDSDWDRCGNVCVDSEWTRDDVCVRPSARQPCDSDWNRWGNVCVSRLSVCEVCEQLQQIGIEQDTVSQMKEECVDGRLLQLLDEEALMETFPRMRKIDLKRILMFGTHGWKPKL